MNIKTSQAAEKQNRAEPATCSPPGASHRAMHERSRSMALLVFYCLAICATKPISALSKRDSMSIMINIRSPMRAMPVTKAASSWDWNWGGVLGAGALQLQAQVNDGNNDTAQINDALDEAGRLRHAGRCLVRADLLHLQYVNAVLFLAQLKRQIFSRRCSTGATFAGHSRVGGALGVVRMHRVGLFPCVGSSHLTACNASHGRQGYQRLRFVLSHPHPPQRSFRRHIARSLPTSPAMADEPVRQTKGRCAG